ncbi:MAG: thiamine phosphate synthase [Planctomycetes bacterium]|nr:thiamine phosphate synthase [Planctomycetota bacterium]
MPAAARPFDPTVLQLVLVTDGRGDPARLERIVDEVVAAGVRMVQLREPALSARVLLRTCERLQPRLDAVRGVLLVNDRVDVAASGAAHGAQIGHRSLPAELARAVLGPGPVLGLSAHDRAELDLATAGGCDFALLSPVWPTSSKPGAPHLGAVRAGQLTAAARLPVVWLGGVGMGVLPGLAALPRIARPAGFAVRSAIMEATAPGDAAAELLKAIVAARDAAPSA